MTRPWDSPGPAAFSRVPRMKILLIALALALPTIAPAQSTSYDVVADVRIPMPDGVLLDADEYIPTTGCPCPTILVQTPYRKSGSAVSEGNTIFPSNGYAMVVVDVRGTGSSEGMWDSFGALEQQDSVTLVQFAASQPFSNGIVGLSGVSYSAINQLLTVEQPGTEAVKAIFPIVPMADSYRDVTWAGGNEDAGFIPLWLGLVNGLALVPASDAQSQPAIALNAESQHALDIGTFGALVLMDAALGGYEKMLPTALQTLSGAGLRRAILPAALAHPEHIACSCSHVHRRRHVRHLPARRAAPLPRAPALGREEEAPDRALVPHDRRQRPHRGRRLEPGLRHERPAHPELEHPPARLVRPLAEGHPQRHRPLPARGDVLPRRRRVGRGHKVSRGAHAAADLVPLRGGGERDVALCGLARAGRRRRRIDRHAPVDSRERHLLALDDAVDRGTRLRHRDLRER